MEFRRIPGLPTYVFTITDTLKVEARREGRDVVDLGFGNPDLPSPGIAVDKLAEAARIPRNHRYSASRGTPKLGPYFAGADVRQVPIGVRPDGTAENYLENVMDAWDYSG
jgi:alanine-synthesizing transaminase